MRLSHHSLEDGGLGLFESSAKHPEEEASLSHAVYGLMNDKASFI